MSLSLQDWDRQAVTVVIAKFTASSVSA